MCRYVSIQIFLVVLKLADEVCIGHMKCVGNKTVFTMQEVHKSATHWSGLSL